MLRKSRKFKRQWTVGIFLAALTGFFLGSSMSQFMLGGALVNVGYRLQDRIHDYDFEHGDSITPAQVWNEFRTQNRLASAVRSSFPRSVYHPLVAILVCMDARIDTNELAGDTRREYYVIRNACSLLSTREEEMLELAVLNGVKVIALTRHTDCAAEKAAVDPQLRKKFPALVAAIKERDRLVIDFLKRPLIAERVASGQLIVKQLLVDTASGRLAEQEASGISH